MTDLHAPRLLAQRTFTCDDHSCPQCGQRSVLGALLVNERQEHMHTWYFCTFWPSSVNGTAQLRCGWTGWSVPDESSEYRWTDDWWPPPVDDEGSE